MRWQSAYMRISMRRILENNSLIPHKTPDNTLKTHAK